MTTPKYTNIKNLPTLTDGRKYFTEYGYSQAYPWVEIKRTAKTITLARVNVERDSEWTPEFISGGFAGHCQNQHEQTWVFKSIDTETKKTIRLTKKGWTHKNVRFDEDKASYFYDYNF